MRLSILLLLALTGCGASWKDEDDALLQIARDNSLAVRYVDGGMAGTLNKASYCGIRGLEMRHKLTVAPDAGLVCPQ